MTENEQVEEMARCLETHTCMSGFQAEIGARVLYSKGYHKVERGEWEIAIGYDPNKKVKCPVCNLMDYEPIVFCPHCGADMRGEINER